MNLFKHGNTLKLSLLFVSALLFCLIFATKSSAQTEHPLDSNSRNFETHAGGWTSSIDYGGVCIPPITCATVIPEYVDNGGTDQQTAKDDGYYRTNFGGILSLGSHFTVTSSSPEFTIPADWGNKAILKAKVRNSFSNILPIDYSGYTRLQIVDTENINTPILVQSRTDLNPDTDWAFELSGDISEHIHPGKRYRIQIIHHLSGPLGVVATGSYDFDDVSLTVSTENGNNNNNGNNNQGGDNNNQGNNNNNSNNNQQNHSNNDNHNINTLAAKNSQAGVLGEMLKKCLNTDVIITRTHYSKGKVIVQGSSGYNLNSNVTIQNQAQRTVATTKVDTNGEFKATFKAPSKRARNYTQYRAVISNSSSPYFRLIRNASLQKVSKSGTNVTLQGTVNKKRIPKNKKKVFVYLADKNKGCGSSKKLSKVKTVGKNSISSKSGKFKIKTKSSTAGPVIVKLVIGNNHTAYFIR